MRKLFSGKRGNLTDIIEYIGISFGVGVLIVVVSWFLIAFFDSLDSIAANSTIIPNASLAIAEQASTTFPPAFDYILPILYVFFVVFSVWSARKIPSSYLLVWLYPFMALFLIFISLIAESAWQEFIGDSNFNSIRDIFFVTNFFISYLRYFVLFYSGLVGWALYAKDE